ncbi:stage II sporulation protein M [Methanobacterium sp.]|uniref:stage II sporulation protein M n=1 Tax=Methanobacterium sp. TaxID=2164 RepID=UPI003C7920BB
MKRSVKIVSLVTAVLVSLLVIGYFESNTSEKIFALALTVWILGIGTIISILLESTAKRSIKVVLLITSILASLGIITSISQYNALYLTFAALMMGIGTGILSTLVEKRSKSLFYSSVVIILLGGGLISVYHGYTHPTPIDQRYVITNLQSFYTVFTGYFFNNTFVTFISLLGGPTIIFPYSQLSYNIAGDFPEFIGSLASFYGFKGVILILGWLNAYPELIAAFLACMAGIRVSLESFQAFIHIKRNGLFNSLMRIRNAMVFEIINTMPKVVALLLIAAVLETLWTQFWVNYWLQNIL